MSSSTPKDPAGRGPADERTGTLARIARNSAFGLAASMVSAVFALLSVMILARALGKELLGRYYSVFVIIVVVQLLTEAGVFTVLTRRLSQAPARWREIIAQANGLLVVITLAAAAIMAVVGVGWSAVAGEPLYLRLCLLGAVACAGMQLQLFAAGLFRGFERFELEGLGKVLQWVLFAGLAFAFVKPGHGALETALSMLAVSYAVTAVVMVGVAQVCWPCRRLVLAPRTLKDWFGESVPLGLADIFRRMTLQIDQILLILLQPPAVSGIYAVAYRPLGPLNLLPRAIVSATFPFFARSATDAPERMRRAFSSTIRLLWIMSLPIAITIAVFAPQVVRILAGPDFQEAAAPLRVLMGVLICAYPSTQFRFALAAIGKQRVFTILVFAGLVFETAVEAALIPAFGYMGACTGFLIGEIAFTSVGLVVCQRLGLGRAPLAAVARALPAAAVMTLILWAGRHAAWPLLIPLTAFAWSVYLALCVVLAALPRGELATLATALSRAFRPGRANRSASGPAS